ncbi:MAG: LPXTG cell wall anchor domain-containing protein [Clostridia bacterium]|nr:LPXTG cell wall anchor domain-containing protein [Clostridia bacterium]
MKKMLSTTSTKLISVLLSIALVLSVFVGLTITASAITSSNAQKFADSATLDGWQKFFGSSAPSTVNAGGVWTDKSVFVDGSSFSGLTDAYNDPISPTVSDDSFLVALSAIASNKSIVGYSHIPTDTLLLLDISGSMGPGNSNNDAVADLVLAANAAVTKLLALNNNNRVGVVLYSAEYDRGNDFHYYTLLPVDRYSATDTITYNNGTFFDTSDDVTVGKFFVTNNNENTFAIASGVKNSNNTAVHQTSIDVVGGTYIQGGLDAIDDIFASIAANNDTVIKDGFQKDAQRKPVVVLMSDGSPTYATTSFANPGNPNLGNGSSTNSTYAFLTQLTAALVKEKASEYYGNEALFYTLGLGVGNDNIAQSVLNPAASTNTIAGYWNNYNSAANNSSLEITNGVTITKSDAVTDINYADQYFSASTGTDLFEAFDRIVNEIIIQSLYRPTLIENNNAHMEGYIEFIDDIGDFMKVEQIEGILIGNKLFTGEKLSENFKDGGGSLGTVANPNELGNNFIWAVKERLGITDTQVARQLVTLAYEHGQLSYTSPTEWSNYIGWYADEDGKFLGFWDKSHTYSQMPDNAVYINKSYGMLGEVKDGHNISDLMYVSIQVHTEIEAKTASTADTDVIKPAHSQLIFRVPASLIPVVSYSVTLEGTGYEDARNIEMTISDASPIRLLFEIGLRDDINEFNIQQTVGNAYRGQDGKYHLYTNEWSAQQFDDETHPSNPTYIHPTESINTIAYFEPNLSNERYYYTEPTPVYYLDGSVYKKYQGATAPKNVAGVEFFRQINTFALTDSVLDGNAANLIKTYEKISAEALAVADDDENNYWFIPKNTIHRVYDEIETAKVVSGGGETKTLEYSYFPTVEHLSGTHYYADAILGNNGLLVITPATGIMITKTVDETLTGTASEFTFNVNLKNVANRSFDLMYRTADGSFETRNNKLNVDSNGNGTVTIKAGETVYIDGIDTGVEYTITETEGATYKVKSSSGTTGTIVENTLAEVKFENTLKNDGYLVISKAVEHPFAEAPSMLRYRDFSFEIELSNSGAAYPDATVEVHYSDNPDVVLDFPVVNNKVTAIILGADESVFIKIKEGWKATVTEKDIPDGFSIKSQTVTPADAIISTTENVVYRFVNTYEPASVKPNATITSTKEFVGRPWTSADSFTFTLSQYNPKTAEFVKVPGGEETVTNTLDGVTTVTFGVALTNAFKQVEFTEVGTYHFSITENAPADKKGITFDTASRDFNVIVTDEDLDGALEIKEIVNANRTAVNASVIEAQKFVNSYAASGIAEITFEINKTVDVTDNNMSYALDGFEFGIYDKVTGELIGTTNTTDENGKATFTLSYNANGVDYQNNKVFRYVIKETNSKIPGMTYVEDMEVTVTVTDKLDGTIIASSSLTSTKQDGTVLVDRTNVYNPDNTKVDVNIAVDKTVQNTGTATIGPEGFHFVLVENDASGDKEIDRVTSDTSGKAAFEKLTFTGEDVGKTFTYTVTEIEGTLANVDYSQQKYEIVVNVLLDENNKVIAKVTCNTEDVTNNVTVEFVNVHSGNLPTPTPTPTPAPAPKPVATGDNASTFLWIGLVLAIGGGLVIVAKKKKEKEEE